MNYRVVIHREAEKEFAALPRNIQERLKVKLLCLEDHPRPPGSKKLQNSGNHRLRVGDYRAICSINDVARRVFILSVGHRKDVYRKIPSPQEATMTALQAHRLRRGFSQRALARRARTF